MEDIQKVKNMANFLEQYIRGAGDYSGVMARTKTIIKDYLDEIINHETRVLDVGAGDCVSYELLKDKVAEWEGINKGIDLTNTKNTHNIKDMDMHFLDYGDNQFDLVLCINVLEHAYCPLLVLFEIARVTTHYAYFQIPVPAALGGIPAYEENPDHYYIQSTLMWEKLFYKAGFGIVKKDELGGEYRYLLSVK